MTHQEQIDFYTAVKQEKPEYFLNRFVLDIGSLDLNGNNQYLFENSLYLGVDLLPGRNVDLASKAHELTLPDNSIDTIITTEFLEYDQHYDQTLKNIIRMLKPGGFFIFSCATTGRAEHGIRRSKPQDAPFTQEFDSWGDYYKNLNETDIRAILDIDQLFIQYAFSVNNKSHDLYFWGIKRGDFIARNDYSFQIERSIVNTTLQKKDIEIQKINESITKYQTEINEYESKLELIKNNAQIELHTHQTLLNKTIGESEAINSLLDKTITKYDTTKTQLDSTTFQYNATKAQLELINNEYTIIKVLLEQKIIQFDALKSNYAMLVRSNSWKVTLSFRELRRWLSSPKVQTKKYLLAVSNKLDHLLKKTTNKLAFIKKTNRRVHHNFKLLLLIRKQYGIGVAFKKAKFIFKQQGLAGVKTCLYLFYKKKFFFNQTLTSSLLKESIANKNHYKEWVSRYDTLDDEKRLRITAQINAMSSLPKISIVMPVYNPCLKMLKEAIDSVRTQLYPNWELCIADDASTNLAIPKFLKEQVTEDSRIKLSILNKNGHISAASNAALTLVTGEFIALLDHDDLIPEDALFWVAHAINNNPKASLFYSDEDKVDEEQGRHAPYFKPDWNYDLFLSHNMISHLGVYRTSLIHKIGGWRVGYEGSQDYDLALRCIEHLSSENIVHISRILYHWRAHENSTSLSADTKPYAVIAGEKVLNEHLKRKGVSGTVEHLNAGYKVNYTLPKKQPLISLIIPTRNGLNLLKQCIDSILTKTTYLNYELLIIDNNSDEPETLDYLKKIQSTVNIRVIKDKRPFNYSALNNNAIKRAKGTLVALINNDIEVIDPNWLSEMVSLALQPGVGAVGARLLYPNNQLQHGGVILGLLGVAGHAHRHNIKEDFGYFGRAAIISSFSAVTAACLVIKKSIYNQVNGLNENELKVAFNDVDFCLRVREAGYRNVYTPYALLYHHESATRGLEDTPEKEMRFSQEIQYMKTRWGKALLNDPAYNRNLTLEYEDFSLAWPPRIVDEERLL